MSGFTIDESSLSKLLSRTNLLRTAAIGLLGSAAYAAMQASGKAAGPAGMSANDVINTLLPTVGAFFAWLASTWFKIKPDLLQAVTAVIANPKDPVADLRLVAAVFSYVKGQWPEAPEAIGLLSDGLKKLTDAVGNDLVKSTVSQVPAPSPTAQ